MAADLIPETKSRVGVQFTLFKIFGLIPIKAPEGAKGNLDTTFVDEELRISRGDKGETAQYMSSIFCGWLGTAITATVTDENIKWHVSLMYCHALNLRGLAHV